VPHINGTVSSSPTACLNASWRSQFDDASIYVHADNNESHEIPIRQLVKLDINSPYDIPSLEKDPDLPLHHIRVMVVLSWHAYFQW
jgi:hypothetical protein